MHAVRADGHLAELAILDVVDVTPEGAYVLNAAFRAACITAYDEGADLETVFAECILARALERGYAGCADLDALALAALEIGAAAEADA